MHPFSRVVKPEKKKKATWEAMIHDKKGRPGPTGIEAERHLPDRNAQHKQDTKNAGVSHDLLAKRQNVGPPRNHKPLSLVLSLNRRSLL
jgi:hypothetical protein